MQQRDDPHNFDVMLKTDGVVPAMACRAALEAVQGGGGRGRGRGDRRTY